MKKLLLPIVIICFLYSCQNNSGSTTTITHTDANGFQYETVTNDPTGLRLYTLDNGLKVYLSKNIDEPKIQTLIGVRAGSVYDPTDNTGLAHYLEHMLFKGTDEIGTSDWDKEKGYLEQIEALYEEHKNTQDPKEKNKIYREIDRVSQEASRYSIANEYDKMVASLGAEGTNAWTWHEETVYTNKIPSNQFDKWLTLEKERFSQLVLRIFHTELEAVYEEFNRGQDSDSRKLNYTLMDALFPEHPYGQQTTIGTAEHLKNPSLKAIKNYFNTYYVPNNMAVILVGDLEFESTIQKVDAAFGEFESKELQHPKLPKETPLRAVKTVEVSGPDSEVVNIAFRTAGVGSDEEKYMTLIDMILSNSTAGLIDLNLNQQQKILGGGSSNRFFKDYGMYTMYGRPKQGQSLDEVKDLLLSQIEEIKKGNFDEWLIEAVVNDLRVSQIREFEDASSLARTLINTFTTFQDWEDRVRFLDEIQHITKKDLVAFANTFFGNNYVVAFKRQGEATSLVKVNNPEITPIQLNRDKQSPFVTAFYAKKAAETPPIFVDFEKEIQRFKLNNGIEMAFVQNPVNSLSSLYVIFDMGSDHIKKIQYAISYLDYLGTSKYSAEELKKEFYKLGINFNVSSDDEQIRFNISGLQENMADGLALMEHVISNAKVDTEAYDKYLDRLAKSRDNTKKSKQNILWGGLMSYIQYGENSRLRNVSKLEELKNTNPQELVDLIHNLPNFKHRFFFYGKDAKEMLASTNRIHQVPENLKDYPKAAKFMERETSGEVYFVNYDMVQAEILLLHKGRNYDPAVSAAARMYNSYFGQGLSSIVFQEIRESRSLAYSSASIYSQGRKTAKPDYILNYLGTQANKINQAVDAIVELLNNMPKNEQQFDNARLGQLKRIEAERITKENIFWRYESNRKRGIDNDFRENVYNSLKTMSLDDLDSFFKKQIVGKQFDIGVIGNEKDINFKALSKFNTVKKLNVDYLFNF